LWFAGREPTHEAAKGKDAKLRYRPLSDPTSAFPQLALPGCSPNGDFRASLTLVDHWTAQLANEG